jgi:aminoglycoside phosphotransferase family enzyme/predicted kinase
LLSDYALMIAGLQSPDAYPHPAERLTHLETHASHVFLAGDLAYKVKKPVNLGFLDFSTLERRRFFCGEELRLNRRLAPDTYMAVVPITGTPEAPKVAGPGEALEYAVMMRRFPQRALLSRRRVTPDIVDRIAERLAVFHASVAVAPADSPYGTPDAVLGPLLDNLAVLAKGPVGAAQAGRIRYLSAWIGATFPGLKGLIEQRRRDGWVRECHGDLHRDNIAEVDGCLIIFDGIEFDPALRWIDTINEVAFLAMDLAEAEAQPLARRFINHYLERTGDYAGVGLLDLYRVYRATVRAKVTAIRLSQPGLEANEVLHHRDEFVRYLAQAEVYTAIHIPRLILTHGRSGSGKTHLSVILREHLRLIHIRSDIERKRLFGLLPEARAGAAAGTGIYTPEATRRTYGRLLDLARSILGAGYSVLVDATFLGRAQRAPFSALATELGARCTILSIEAPDAILRARLAKRVAEGCDASDADISIVDVQRTWHEPLHPGEADQVIPVQTHPGADLEALLAQLGD